MSSSPIRATVVVALLVASAVAGGCADRDDASSDVGSNAGGGDRRAVAPGPARLRPFVATDGARGSRQSLSRPGLHELSIGRRGRALLRVPEHSPGERLPLVLVLHGAGGSAESGLRLIGDQAAARGVAVLAPASRGRTWDVILGDFGPDVEVIDALLQRVTRVLPVDVAQTAVAGFSDGASYALSLGLTNGDRFSRVIAFSPGFSAPRERRGRPPVYVSHGTEDAVLPIGQTSRRLVPALRRAGHRVRYREFSGGHTVPPRIAAEALRLLLGESSESGLRAGAT